MKQFILGISKNIYICIEQAKEMVFAPDEFIVFLKMGYIKFFLHNDSLYYDIAPELKRVVQENNSDLLYQLKYGYLSKQLFHKGTQCFHDRIYEKCVWFHSNRSFIVIFVKHEEGLYLEIAKLNIDEEKYKLVFHKKIDMNTYLKWNETIDDMQNYSITKHKELFGL